MAAHYSLRLSYPLRADPEQVERRLLQLAGDTAADEITLMIFCEDFNDGHETLDELRQWLALIRPWKESLERLGIAVSLNPWATVLHCDRGRRLKPSQPWQTMVDWRGRAAAAVVCPLDPGWRRYYREALALYAEEGFRVIWLEDDIRLANHAPLDWGGCFCPLHVAEFNRRAGTSATREEIVARLVQPGPPHPWRATWLDMWDETQTQMVAGFRAAVEPGGGRLGLMSSGPAMHAMEGRHWSRWWQALSASVPPVHRPHVAGYTDALGAQWPGAIHMLDMNRTAEPDDCEVAPEIESFPHGWSKSLRQTAAQMVLSQVLGAQRLNLSLYDYLGNPPEDTPEVAAFLAGWKPTLDWLSDLFPPSLRSQGVGCPWSEEMTYRRHATPGATTFMASLFTPTHGWPTWLGSFGQAFQMRLSPAVNALAGEMVWAFSDEEIGTMLSCGLLLDGGAAAILAERGFGPWLGLERVRFITQSDLLYSVEVLTDAQFARREGALVSLNDRPCSQHLAQGELLPGARAVSALCGPDLGPVGHGVVIYENGLGGRVAVCPWDVNAPLQYGAQQNIHRAAQVRALVHYLGRERPLGSAWGAPWVVSQFLTDGERWRGVIWNAYPDEVTDLRVQLPAEMPAVTEAIQIDAHGNRRACRYQEAKLDLAVSLHQWECVVLLDGR